MLSTLYYLQGFNNYFNRQVKKPGAALVSEYSEWVVKTTKPCSFNPNDDIITSITANIPDDAEPDYLVVSEDNVNVSSRWFIIERKRNLSNQWEISLKRDLFADYWNAISNSPCYIEKATLTVDNPLIYNSENQSFNKIKTKETLLMDATKTPWVCVYLHRNQPEPIQISTRADIIENTDISYEYSDIQALIGKTIYGDFSDPVLTLKALYYNRSDATDVTEYHFLGGFYESEAVDPLTPSRIYNLNSAYPDNLMGIAEDVYVRDSELKEDMLSYLRTQVNDQTSLINELKTLESKTIKDTNSGTLYTVNMTRKYILREIRIGVNSSLYSSLNGYLSSNPYFVASNYGTMSNWTTSVWMETLTIDSTEVVEGIPLTCTIPAGSNRTHLTDAPYDMLAFPYNGGFWVRTASTPNVSTATSPNTAVALAQAISESLADFVIDVQLLPFCPCMEYFNGVYLDLTNLTHNVNYIQVYGGSPDVGDVNWGIFCNKTNFRANITDFEPINTPTNAIDFKVANECDMYRLCSPNYASAFEFSATKNGGIRGFDVNCTYKPLQPYIHINPIFDKLYGTDFNDNRGLTCAGDFSLPYATDKWEQYKIQNKAYEEAHARDIQNMETTYDIQREQMKTQSTVNTITGIVSGGASGGLIGQVGGIGGVAAGAVIGAAGALAANLYGAAKDLEYADRLHKESMSYAEDKWNLSLENIKALPMTLNNIGAFDINYKGFPFLEYYTCTDVEKEALRSRLKYNGFTVNAIGTIGSYSVGNDSFIQGQLIRYIGEGDYHLTAAIADELHKGVYI